MVAFAEKQRVRDRRLAAVLPVLDVVRVASPRTSSAAGRLAVPVAGFERATQPRRRGALLASDVEDIGGVTSQEVRQRSGCRVRGIVGSRSDPVGSAGDDDVAEVRVAQDPADGVAREQGRLVVAGHRQLAAQPGEQVADVDVEHRVRADAVVRADLAAVEEAGQDLAQREGAQVGEPGPLQAAALGGLCGDPVGQALLRRELVVAQPCVDALLEDGHDRGGSLGVEVGLDPHLVSGRDAGERLLAVGVELGLPNAIGVEHEAKPCHRTLELGDGVRGGQGKQQVERLRGHRVAACRGQMAHGRADSQRQLAHLVVADRTGQPLAPQPRIAGAGGVAQVACTGGERRGRTR